MTIKIKIMALFLVALLMSISLGESMSHADVKEKGFAVQYTKQEWKERLNEEEYRVLIKEGTEPPYSSDLNEEKRPGTFVCAACGNDLFKTRSKFDSGTGWPSFTEPVEDGAVGTKTDYKLIWPRTEVHCADCGGHLGHVFEDGPDPTGLRYCINGVAMDFKPENAE